MTLALPVPAATPPRGLFGALPLALRLARRSLRGGVAGARVVVACVALGVAAIAGVGSVARGLQDGLAREGRTILGADAAFVLIHRQAAPDERAFLAARGAVDEVALTRAMARAPEGEAALVELKAVDPAAYPRHGALVTAPSAPAPALLAPRDGAPGGAPAFGAIADPALLARLDLKVGDALLLGDARLVITAILEAEPDKLAGGIGFGPRLLVSRAALDASGLVQPGSLVRFAYRVSLPPGRDGAADLRALEADAKSAFPNAGWEVRPRDNVSPQFGRNIERFAQFLTLVGLTALLVGGVGVANAARAQVERQRATHAALKSLGATGGLVVGVALLEVGALALVGVAIGLVIGAAAPFLIQLFAGSLLPFPLAVSVQPRELALAALYGLLAAGAFALWPLGRAHDAPVPALFRGAVDEGADARPRARYALAALGLGLLLAALSIAFAFDRRVAAIAIGASLAAFLALRLVAAGVMRMAAALPRPRRAELRLAVANIHRPGALTPSVILSLGLGLTLLVALAVIDGSIRDGLTRNLPGKAPNFFFVDVPSAQAPEFDALLRRLAPGGALERVPMMRGRVVSLKGVPAERVKAPEKAAWVLEGDRGITYADALPPDSRVVAGAWWPANYAGPPLVSFERELAEGLGLAVGDEVVVNVLGRPIAARIANLRTVEWRSFGINFVMVFSPNAFAGAPHADLATLTLPPGAADAAREGGITREVARAFPAVSSVRVKDALEAVEGLVARLANAIRAAAVLALASSALVLAGALAAGRAARVREAVILKTLGATRRRLLAALVAEYAMLGVAAALFGALAGVAAGWGVLRFVMDLPATLPWGAVATSLAVGLLVTVGLGLAGTWRVLGERPAAHLRAP